jgi:ATP-dependent 26S proteasome regulatory subunit
METVLDAAAGLTRLEAENAFSLSLVRHGRITPDAIWELKSGMLKKSGLLQLYRGVEKFDSLGGLENLKAFCKRSLLQPSRDNPLKRPRGVLLLGVSGTGKSAFAKALGRETDRPTLVLDIGALMGSLVGQTESNIRRALQIADAMAPCILFIDELEKALSGAAGSGQSDSGVSSRLFGTLLSWMNDHTSNVYLVATCNDISKMPPELSRAERFDGIVFLDLPGREQKDRIWEQYIAAFELDVEQRKPKDESWTGAEIRSCCRLAALLDVPLMQAAVNVVPVATTASESVEGLRTWASGRCLDAEKGGIYQVGKTKRRRAVKAVGPAPSNN